MSKIVELNIITTNLEKTTKDKLAARPICFILILDFMALMKGQNF